MNSEKSGAEEQISYQNIRKNLTFASTLIQQKLAEKFSVIDEMVEAEIGLLGIYATAFMIKSAMGLSYKPNLVTNNVTANQAHISLSTILLLKEGLYGSARIILRQFFEGLLIAKYSEYDNTIITKWSTNHGKQDYKNEIKLKRDVFNKMKGIAETSSLEEFWVLLCNVSHSTKYAQQPLLVPKSEGVGLDRNETLKWIEDMHLIPNTEHTLDMLFVLLCMNFHLLIGYQGRRARRWWFGYQNDPYGSYMREKEYKKRMNNLIERYFAINDGQKKELNIPLKKQIRQYKLLNTKK